VTITDGHLGSPHWRVLDNRTVTGRWLAANPPMGRFWRLATPRLGARRRRRPSDRGARAPRL